VAAVDTNVLLRLLVDDDEEQTRDATAFVRSAGSVFVSHVVVVEAAWVLSGVYELSRLQLSRALELVLTTDAFTVERPDVLVEALKLFGGSKADFADCVIAATARAAGELPLATFDVAASRLPDARRLGRKRKK
jgi:predicted nucleic-acid-binding protein